jgi:hypothetical protein
LGLLLRHSSVIASTEFSFDLWEGVGWRQMITCMRSWVVVVEHQALL